LLHGLVLELVGKLIELTCIDARAQLGYVRPHAKSLASARHGLRRKTPAKGLIHDLLHRFTLAVRFLFDEASHIGL
jgi:hypothetical protein